MLVVVGRKVNHSMGKIIFIAKVGINKRRSAYGAGEQCLVLRCKCCQDVRILDTVMITKAASLTMHMLVWECRM